MSSITTMWTETSGSLPSVDNGTREYQERKSLWRCLKNGFHVQLLNNMATTIASLEIWFNFDRITTDNFSKCDEGISKM